MLVKIQDPKRESYLSIPFDSQVVRVDVQGCNVFATPIFGGAVRDLKYCVARCNTEASAQQAANSLLSHIEAKSNSWYFEEDGGISDDDSEGEDESPTYGGWNSSQEG